MKCLRRNENPGPFKLSDEDTWEPRENGDLTCSYCGSMHPDKVLEIANKVIAGEKYYDIEGTTKNYKVYIRQPGIQNALQGGIKFYIQHAPEDPADENKFEKGFIDTLNKAINVSSLRFEEYMKARHEAHTRG